jgi:hypothetical protein
MNTNDNANYTIFNDIKPFVSKEVNNIIQDHLDKKNYNVNEAQVWSNLICDEVQPTVNVDSQGHHQRQ